MVSFLAKASTWIQPEDGWALWAIIAGWVALSIWIEQRYRWAAKVSGPVLVLIGSIALSNLGVIPGKSPVYDTVWTYVIPISVALLLFRANLGVIARSSGSMFVAFHIAALGTMIGGVIAFFALRGHVEHLPQLCGIMTGSYTGGSVNFAALSQTFDPDQKWKPLLDSLLVADNLVMALVFFLCFALPTWPFLRRRYGTPHQDEVEQRDVPLDTTPAAEYWKPRPIALMHIAMAFAVAIAIVTLATAFASWVGGQTWIEGLQWLRGILSQKYFAITTLCVIVATAFSRPLERLAGTEELGTYLIYYFFFVIGTEASVVKIIYEVPILFAFCGIMAAVNILVTLGLGRLLNRNLEELAIAINATLGGAPSAAAMAIAKGYRALVLPAFLVGIWGYVIGLYLGLIVANALLGLV